ncbi:hypothetical protein HanIR_Chr13g0628791 [Helianthus annuus]|nr:hypothetical protein HanIR_Chr13g0628791 [Helianthus annuus]
MSNFFKKKGGPKNVEALGPDLGLTFYWAGSGPDGPTYDYDYKSNIMTIIIRRSFIFRSKDSGGCMH